VLLAKKLQATLDLPRQRAYLAAIQCEVPIIVISGHLAIDIAKFAVHAHEFEQWGILSRLSDAHECDPEFVFISPAMLKAKPDFPAASSDGSSSRASQQAWRRFMGALIEAELLLARVMIQAVRMRIRPRYWLHYQDPLLMNEMMTVHSRAVAACPHEKIQRSGNRHGRYSKCLLCGKSWVWDEAAQLWTEPKASPKQRQLPLPSSSTGTIFKDKGYTPAASMGFKDLSLNQSKDKSSASTALVPSRTPRGARPKQRAVSKSKRNSSSLEGDQSDFDWDLVDQ